MILLLGGTGVIGTYLKDMFLKTDQIVYITSRSVRKDIGNVHYIQGNARDLVFLKQILKLQEWECIVDFMSYKTDEFKQRLDLLLKSTKQYIFISTARVYGNTEVPRRENSPRLLDCSKDFEFLSTDEYSLTKARQENLLIKSVYNNYTIVRPCITYGDERLQLGVLEKEEWLYRAMRGRTVIFCNEIARSLTTMTNGYDLSQLLYKTICNPKAIGEIYHFTSKEHRTWNEIIQIYSSAFYKITNIELKIKNVSLESFLKTRSPYLKYQVIYDRISDCVYDTTKESSLLNIDDFITPEEGLSACLRNFITKNHSFKSINWKYEAIKDKIAKEHTPLSEIKGLKNKIKYIVERYLK